MTELTLGVLGVGLVAAVVAFSTPSRAGADEVVLIEGQNASCVVHVAPRVMADDEKVAATPRLAYERELDRRRLRESVKDLAHYLGLMTGATVPVVQTPPAAGQKEIPILIGELAEPVFGKVRVEVRGGQGGRLVVSPKGIGLFGQADIGSSYAIYELLHDLGCRWYLPGELGEVIPTHKRIALPQQDRDVKPYTLSRNIWYASDDYKRRNRVTSLSLAAGHALEMYLTKEDREKHPEWRATVDGKPHPHRLKWSAPGVADAIAARIIAQLDKDYVPSVSLSPDDGLGYDNSPEDKALDAGDFDPTIQDVSLTDRLLVLCNKIANTVTAKYPDVRFGLLAYAPYTRPPVRAKPHANIVPVIAPITFSRAHPMSDDRVPDNVDLRRIIEGWSRLCPEVAFYYYGWFLAEPAAPFPMLTKWGNDVPFALRHNGLHWNPESITSFETNGHGMYMALRLAWNPEQDPWAIYAEMDRNLYGHAADAMSRYWKLVDQTWTECPEYSGCGFGYLRRFPREKVAQWRTAMDEALAACRTVMEYRRVKLADDSLRAFEVFMKLRYDLADGRWSALPDDVAIYRGMVMGLAQQYAENSAFGVMGWTGPRGIYIRYFDAFYKATYDSAAGLTGRGQTLLLRTPLRQFAWQADPQKQGEAAGWHAADAADKDWGQTDVCQQTWSALGHHNYMGTIWYRAKVRLAKAPAGKKVYFWIGATDGRAKVWVNGKHVPFVKPDGGTDVSGTGYCTPLVYDATEAVIPGGGDNVLAIEATREFINELGTGGLLAPTTFYAADAP